jgi:AcrR family transcriptional regulator
MAFKSARKLGPGPERAAGSEHKRNEIVRAARELLLRDGYEATSILRLAAEVGVAPNTLYWYFDDKDAVLIAVLDSLLDESLKDFDKRRRAPLEAQLLWVLELFARMPTLIATVHSRAASSEHVRTWHEGFHRMLEATIAEQLRARGLARGHEAHAAKATMFIVEGMLAHELAPAERRKLVKWIVSRVR